MRGLGLGNESPMGSRGRLPAKGGAKHPEAIGKVEYYASVNFVSTGLHHLLVFVYFITIYHLMV